MKNPFLNKIIKKIEKIDAKYLPEVINRLVSQASYFEKVIDSLHEGVIIIAMNGSIKHINRSACDFFGIDMPQAVGKHISTQIKGLDWQKLEHEIHRYATINSNMQVMYPETRLLNFYLAPINASEFDDINLEPNQLETAFNKSPKNSKPKKNGDFVLLLRDITERQIEREKNLEWERISTISSMAASVAHEIGNPLNSIDIHLQILQKKLENLSESNKSQTDESILNNLTIARKEVNRLDSILKQFLASMRPTKPRLKLQDINRLILESIHFLEPELHDKKILIDANLGKQLPLIKIDENQIKQVFYNLLRNAVQAIGNKGTIKISSSVENEDIKIAISDDGAGISPEVLKNIFEPYFTTKSHGTGLGLFIVQRIIREHNGQIQITSNKSTNDNTETNRFHTHITITLPLLEKNIRLLESKGTNKS